MLTIEIRLKGLLDQDWAEWLEGFTITHTPDDQTILSGVVPDQTSLYGLITRLRDLGVKLAAVNLIETSRDETK